MNIANLTLTDSVYLKNHFNGSFYAVYDSCISGNIPSWDVPFIEERSHQNQAFDYIASDEKHFSSLKEAKIYVKDHFQSEAEYFSLNQTNDPDNFVHILVDKFTYMMA